MLCWNKTFWLVKTSHITCNTQSEWFISAYHGYATLKYFMISTPGIYERWKGLFSHKKINGPQNINLNKTGDWMYFYPVLSLLFRRWVTLLASKLLCRGRKTRGLEQSENGSIVLLLKNSESHSRGFYWGHPYPRQRHSGHQDAVFQLQLELTRPRARLKPTSGQYYRRRK